MNADQLSQNVHAVRQRISAALEKAGRSPDEVRLVAVTKTVGPKEVKMAFDAGLTDLGENRWPDAEPRVTALPAATGSRAFPVWHFIGTLQKNKIRKVLPHFRWIHSVDSAGLLKAISSRIDAEPPSLLIEVNVSAEVSKAGARPEDLEALLSEASALDNVTVKGLMTMAPYVPKDATRPVFRALRELRDEANRRSMYREPLAELSMGMTNDFEVAIEEGATIVRIGTAIFAPETG